MEESKTWTRNRRTMRKEARTLIIIFYIVFLGRLAEAKAVSDIATYHCNMKALIGGENNDFAGIVTPPDLFTTNHHL